MMRCIDHPTMVKDGSGWGAMVGVSAALLAQNGFTGAPALTVETAEAAALWADLGQNWRINEQYFKPYAVCRWAQPAIVATLALHQSHHIPLETIKRIQIFSFDEAVRLMHPRPQNTEEAQYSLPFPVAAALVHGRLGPAELSGKGLTDPAVLALSDRIELEEDPVLSGRFPAQRFARVRIETKDGHIHDSGEVQANWKATDQPDDTGLREKFRWLAGTTLPSWRVTKLEEAVWQCADLPDAAILEALLAPPAEG
jgi:2-methylcitrate dehydratase PrpD